MASSSDPIVTRFAPSPTGFMHVGGLRTALFAYLWARKNNGTFLLRIEDTDKEREVPGAIEHIMESLRWIGLEWDFGPDKEGPFGSCIQSERLPTYKEAAEKLVAAGLAYPDPYSAEEVDAFRRAAAAEKRPFLFRDHRPDRHDPWDGTRPLRFRVPDVRRMHWHDEVRGALEAGPEALDDFILMKSDGYPTYNFAHIIDDMHMGVTHIMRADEFISSTPKFLSLYEALGITPPAFVTLPPILRDDRTKKLGKRDGAKDVLEYRDDGYLPEAMMNFLALIGWNPGDDREVFSKEELIQAFSIEGIQKGGAALSEEKLQWMNREHIKRLPADRLASEIRDRLTPLTTALPEWSEERFLRALPFMAERLTHFGEVATEEADGAYAFYFDSPKIEDRALLVEKKLRDDPTGMSVTGGNLEAVLPVLETLEEWNSTAVKEAVWPIAEAQGRGVTLWPLRVALSGRERSPDPFSIAAIIGKEATCARVRAAVHNLRA